MKKQYDTPKAEIIEFNYNEIVTASCCRECYDEWNPCIDHQTRVLVYGGEHMGWNYSCDCD